MFDVFANPDDFRALPPFTRKVFLRFVNCANKSALHPLDMRRFYQFIRVCHARRVKLDQYQLHAHLVRAGFKSETAERLSGVYHHGRELLKFGSLPNLHFEKAAAKRVPQLER